MDAPSAARVWRALLPSHVCFSAGGEPDAPNLSPAERRSLPDAGMRRLREFAAGRWHAKRALAELGWSDVDLPRHIGGEPDWPAGAVGSLAHAWQDGHVQVIAATARADICSALGVDLEPPGQIEPRAWAAVLSPAELAAVMALPVPQRGDAVRTLWCAKEAVIKASGVARELRGIGIELDAESGRFDADGLSGRVVEVEGWTFAAAFRHVGVRRAAISPVEQWLRALGYTAAAFIFRSNHMAGLTANTPQPTSITVHQQSRVLEVGFADGAQFRIPFELMRVYSPSAEVQGHGPGQEVLQTGKREIGLNGLEQVGNYAVQPSFSDGHDTGIFSWDYLYFLGSQQDELWRKYQGRLSEAGMSRDAPMTSAAAPGCGHSH